MGRDKQKWKCATCNLDKNSKDHSVICILCKQYSGLECTSYETEMYDYLHSENVELNWMCKKCKEKLPDLIKLRECLVEQSAQQGKNNIKLKKCETDIATLKSDIEKMKERVTKLEEEKPTQEAEDLNMRQLDERLTSLETKSLEPLPIQNTTEIETKILKVVDDKFNEVGLGPEMKAKYAEMAAFPPLAISENFKAVKDTQAETKRRLDEAIKMQKEEKDEQTKIESKKNNLIIFGLPETELTPAQQMLSDFNVLKEIYEERVNLEENDIADLRRIGKAKDNQHRPLIVVFKDTELRNNVLKNNKYLKLERDDFERCECKFPSKHIHIYVTDDKTPKQQELDRKLREELKKKRQDGEQDLVIRNGKIINKKRSKTPRWIEIHDGQLY